MRLFARVRQQSRGIEFLDGDAATAIGNQIHQISPGVLVPLSSRHCERSEAIQHLLVFGPRLLRRFAPRNDD
jgi:hypothetical protein